MSLNISTYALPPLLIRIVVRATAKHAKKHQTLRKCQIEESVNYLQVVSTRVVIDVPVRNESNS